MKLSNLTVYIVASSVISLAWGAIGPFYFLYVNQLGGGDVQQFGISFGILTFMSALTSIVAGRYSDKLGRKPFLVGTSLLYAVTIYSYTLISSAIQLYIIQAVIGVIDAIEHTIHPSFLGDVTKKGKRGAQVGVFNSIVYMFSGIAIILAGFVIGRTGFKMVFYIGSILIALGAVILLGLKETVKKRK